MTAAIELSTWLNGTPTGGPNLDGRYPLTYQDGLTYLVYCPAAQALNPAYVEQPVEIFASAAGTSAGEAATSATTANQAKVDAATSASNAAASATTANTHKNAAAASATAAGTSETNAAGSATAAAGSATTANTAATNASTSAGTATTAKTAAETARDKALKWADEVVDILVETGKYSAKHHAQKAADSAASVAGSLAGKADKAGSTMTGPHTYANGADIFKTALGTRFYSGAAGGTLRIVPPVGSGAHPLSLHDETGVETYSFLNTGPLYRNQTVWHAGNFDPTTKLNKSGDTFAGNAGFGGQASPVAPIDAYLGTTGRVLIRNLSRGINGLDSVNAANSAYAAFNLEAASFTFNGNTVHHTGNFDPATKVTSTPGYLSGSDANTAVNSGFYAIASPSTNTPAGDWTTLLYVGGVAGRGFQIAHRWNATNTLAFRTNTNSTFTAWQDLWHSGNFDPATKLDLTWKDRHNIPDTRGVATLPNGYDGYSAQWDFKSNVDTGAAGDTWHAILTVQPWADFNGEHRQQQLTFTGTGGIKFRYATGPTTWSPHQKILTDADPSDVAGGGTVVKRNPSGYIFANYFNCTANDIAGNTPSRIAVETGSDGYIRWMGASAFINLYHTNATFTGTTTVGSLTAPTAAGAYMSGNGAGLQSNGALYHNGADYILWANGANWVRIPRTFVGGTDPGAAAADGDIWIV